MVTRPRRSRWSGHLTERRAFGGLHSYPAGDLRTAYVEGVGLTVHPHPTLSETVAFAAEVAAGTISDLPPWRRRGAAPSR